MKRHYLYMRNTETVVDNHRGTVLASAPREQFVELDCACGPQLDRAPDEVIWCITDIARHYRRSTRWAYRSVVQPGFPKPTRGDAHRWYKQAIIDWDRDDKSMVMSNESERLRPESAQLSVTGKTVRPSRRMAGAR
jgi:hypothetical protein